jgi:hypothetical protein
MRELPALQQAPRGSALFGRFRLIFHRSPLRHSDGRRSPQIPEALQTALQRRRREQPQRTALDHRGEFLPIAVSFVPRKQSAASTQPPQCQSQHPARKSDYQALSQKLAKDIPGARSCGHAYSSLVRSANLPPERQNRHKRVSWTPI